MLRAVPAMTRNAASSEVEFISLDFILTMSRTCLRVTLPTFSLFGVLEPAVMPAAFFSKDGSRRRLGDERERLVLINRDDHGNHEARVVLGHRVKFLAEAHDVDAVLTERRADGRRGIGLAGRNLQFNLSCNFLCHKIYSFAA